MLGFGSNIISMIRSNKKKIEREIDLTRIEIDNLFLLRRACLKNIFDLIEESEILYKNRKYARSFALAYTAFEEISKFVIVSDFITGILSKKEFESAFKVHNIKAVYGKVKIHIGQDILLRNNVKTSDATLMYNLDDAKNFLSFRNESLYVGISEAYKPLEPKTSYRATDAKNLIKIVQGRIMNIIDSERLNERIGTKALIK